MSVAEKMPLGDFVTLQRGFDLPRTLRREGDVPVVASSGVVGYHNEAKIQAPGVVIGRSGSIGGGQYLAEDFWPLNTTLWIKDFKGNNPRFAYYLLKSIDFTRFNVGAGVPTLNRNHIASLRVAAHGGAAQERIASILSAYDDLIENNRRRIQLLEQAARLLYKEWFVHLRFPGHEHVAITNGVPEGWKPRSLADVTTKIGSGATPRGGAASYKTEGITLIRSLNIYDFHFSDEGLAFIDESQADKLANVIVEPLDILLNITGASVGRCCMVLGRHLPARVNQHVVIIRVDPQKSSPHYVIHTINSHQNKENLLSIARAGGATREALTKGVVSAISLAVPPGHLLDEFERIANELFDQRQVLAAQNVKLAGARDLLLPRLMDGEVMV